MWTTQRWVKVAVSGLCELNVPPWKRESYRTQGATGDVDRTVLEEIFEDIIEGWAQSLVEEFTGAPAGAAEPAADTIADDGDEPESGVEAESGVDPEPAVDALPSERLSNGLAQATEGMQRVAGGLAQAALVGSQELREGAAAAGALAVRVEASIYALAQEAHARGLHRDTGFSMTDWLTQQMPWADRTLLGQVQRVAAACCTHLLDAPVGEALSAGRFPVRRGAIIIDALTKVRRVIDADQYESYVDILLEAAADPDLDDRSLRRATRHLLDLVLDQDERDRRERAAHEQRSVRSQPLGKGLTRFIVDAPDADAAILNGLLGSKLAKPQKGPDGQLDPRTPGQRRYDALKTVVGRGLSCPEGTPKMARATLFITMGLEHLRRDTPGHGISLTGDLLSARQVRQAACEAEIIPVVLGSDSQILDLGRAVRLATADQVKALYLRDGGCTFPSCTVPAQWTIAHHHPWYGKGGATDLDKLVLLCEQHHTHVHQHDLECTIDASGVTWHV